MGREGDEGRFDLMRVLRGPVLLVSGEDLPSDPTAKAPEPVDPQVYPQGVFAINAVGVGLTRWAAGVEPRSSPRSDQDAGPDAAQGARVSHQSACSPWVGVQSWPDQPSAAHAVECIP